MVARSVCFSLFLLMFFLLSLLFTWLFCVTISISSTLFCCFCDLFWLTICFVNIIVWIVRNEPIDSVVNLIWKEYNVNEDSFKRRMIPSLAGLGEDGWDFLDQFLDSVQKKIMLQIFLLFINNRHIINIKKKKEYLTSVLNML